MEFSFLTYTAKENEWKTAFQTRYRTFEWSVMLFRLINTSATFQCFINDVFSNLLDMCIVVYLDNILIYSNDITLSCWTTVQTIKVIFFTIITRITSSRDKFGLPEISLDAQLWTQVYHLSSRVVAVTTTTETS